MTKFILICSVAVLIITLSCNPESVIKNPTLTTKPGSLDFNASGGKLSMVVTMQGNSWVATSDQTWCNLSVTESRSEITNLEVVVTPNNTRESREAIIKFEMNNKESLSVAVHQAVEEGVYPEYSSWIARDNTGMTSNSFELAAEMIAGWNLGNSLEVPGDETIWGNPRVNKTLIDSVKASGINAIRIPCAWDSYVENTSTLKLKSSWLARVKEVIGYCIANDMYVILNIHWDGGWLENNPTYAKQKLVNGKQRAFWEQIAMHFRDYDERLLFAGTNEVHADGNPTNENFEVQGSFNQTFVDAVRSTGGKNSYRNLVIQAYNTNIDFAESKLVVPTDSISGRLMVEVHYYDPWDFCGLESDASWATAKYFWGKDFATYGEVSSWGQEEYLTGQFQKMQLSFVEKGYPVILGEFGAIRRPASISNYQRHLDSRAYFIEHLTTEAKNHGAVPFIWDNGATGNLGMGLFNRNNGSVFDKQLLNAFLVGASSGHYPF